MKKPRTSRAARQRRTSHALSKAPGRALHAAMERNGGGSMGWRDRPLSAPAGIVLRSAASDQAFLEVRGLLPVADDASGPWKVRLPGPTGRTALVNGREKPILKGGFVEADPGDNHIEWSSP